MSKIDPHDRTDLTGSMLHGGSLNIDLMDLQIAGQRPALPLNLLQRCPERPCPGTHEGYCNFAVPRSDPMLKCTHHSVFSWNYVVSGLARGDAQIMFEPFSDQGSILFNDSRLVVRKKGWVNACWTLEQGENIVAVAKKRGIAGRSFDLTWGKDAFLLKQQALIARGYDILLGDAVVGTIEPEHPLTRKAHVECEAAAADIVQLFSFWLVAMVWRSTTDTSPA